MIAATLVLVSAVAAQPPCTPAATNGTCATSTLLSVNASCVNGTTCQGGVQSASTCLYAGSQCSWYRFTATATTLYVNIELTATSGCHISSNVYRSTGPCAGLVQVSCLSGAPLDDMHMLTGLTIGTVYYVQVCYAPGGPCGNSGSAQFCIDVGVPDPPCNVCSTPCGDAFGYTAAPSVAQVVADCGTEPFGPPLQPGMAYTFCNTFTATNPTVSFNVVITSDCGMGNVTNFSWTLYNSPACGGAIQTGTLASLVFTGLTVGNSYVYCYTFTVPANCTHAQHCPYFVGATTPLPVTWLGLQGHVTDRTWVDLDWATATEQDNDHFTVERSVNGIDFGSIGTLPGAGNSTSTQHYAFRDWQPYAGLSYYRVKQTDIDGAFDRSNTIAVELPPLLDALSLIPNPVTDQGTLVFDARIAGPIRVDVFDAYGAMVLTRTVDAEAGRNHVPMSMATLAKGMYLLALGPATDRGTLRFIKDR